MVDGLDSKSDDHRDADWLRRSPSDFGFGEVRRQQVGDGTRDERVAARERAAVARLGPAAGGGGGGRRQRVDGRAGDEPVELAHLL